MPSLRTGVLLLLAAVPVLLFGSAGTAQAHPFGTPPVVRIEVSGRVVDAAWSAQKDDIAVVKKHSGGDVSRYLRSHIVVRQDGSPCRVAKADGMNLRFACPHPVDRVSLTITALTDVNPAYRTLSVTDRGGGGLHTAKEPTRELSLVTGESGSGTGSSAPGGTWTTDLASLLDHGAALPTALLVAAAVGALHACAPGHGKSLAAGYLVGGRGRPRDAMWLGGVVAVMHTFSVAVLAVGWWLMAKRTPDVAALTGWLQLVAALVVVGVGVRLLHTHRRHRRQSDVHAEAHRERGHGGGHGHGRGQGHGHGDGHDHGHSHHIPDAPSLLTWRGLLLLGAAGGLLPSPSAFLVLLAGLLTGKVAVALAMVAAFGVGMALTLTGVGVLVLRSRDALLDRLLRSRALRTWTLRVPVFAASAVVVGGTVASALAVGQLPSP
ncbi:hypothetical protein [Streptomyces longhuiensis]|uniref:hypothetical protein n=1 Tax=Streptomyces longhuiensis TaxID=2880933 RepID=UPI001D0A7ED9|nr:hypothetical protein [Streptomyces longhuiensis]UDL97523.1 hypothetical protein LGI35_04235 [Streptomyces longhuiensis]